MINILQCNLQKKPTQNKNKQKNLNYGIQRASGLENNALAGRVVHPNSMRTKAPVLRILLDLTSVLLLIIIVIIIVITIIITA